MDEIFLVGADAVPEAFGNVSCARKVWRVYGKALRRVEFAFDTSCLIGNSSVGRIFGTDGGGGGSGLERDLNIVHARAEIVPCRISFRRDTNSEQVTSPEDVPVREQYLRLSF